MLEYFITEHARDLLCAIVICSSINVYDQTIASVLCLPNIGVASGFDLED